MRNQPTTGPGPIIVSASASASDQGGGDHACGFLQVRPDAPPQQMTGPIVDEEPLEIWINDAPVAVLMRTPGQEKELAVGFCLGEGLLADFRQVLLVQHCGRLAPGQDAPEPDALDVSRNRVRITVPPGEPLRQPQEDVAPLIRSGCGRTGLGHLPPDLVPLRDGNLQVRAPVLGSLTPRMAAHQPTYRASGGIHAAAIFTSQGDLITLQEDVGRHNAVDKATGHCLIQGIPLEDKILVTTGRASYEMVTKAVRLGIAVAASRSSPTSLAVALARRLNCTLIGYLRRGRFRVYAHPERVIF